ncbi:MAG TPA: hypothetical protein PLY50_11780 [Burkholderiaceae bacterium]|jgi:hypothetical protein|nr:hypothetical protein [Burkholderiaceae bacterium]
MQPVGRLVHRLADPPLPCICAPMQISALPLPAGLAHAVSDDTTSTAAMTKRHIADAIDSPAFGRDA